MGIAHGRRSDFIRLRIQPFVQIGFARIQCFRNHKRFDCRTGFDHIGYGTVAPLFAVCPAGPVGIVGGRIGQGEDFPRAGIQNHHRSGFCLMVFDRLVQLFIGQGLNPLIEGKDDVFAVFRGFIARGVQAVHNIALPVPQNDFRAVFAMQAVFKRKFQTFLTFAVNIGKSDDVCKQVAHRVMAF